MKVFKWATGLLACLAAIPAAAKDLYVNASTGNDAVSYAANGPSAPWRTIGRAAWGNTSRSSMNSAEAARAGDVVYVAEGTYSTPGTGIRYEPSLNPVNSGSATGGHIRFEAQGRVVLQLSSSNGPVIGAYSRSYIHWRGFYINEANAPYAADTGIVTIFSANNIVIDSNEIVGIPTAILDNHNGIRIENSDQIQVINNRIHRITYTADGWGTSHNAAGIMLYGSHDVTMEHNEIHDSNTGIFPKGADNYNIVIRRNLIYGCIKGIRISFSHRTLGQNAVYQNIIRDGDTRTENMAINIGEYTNRYTFANNTINNFNNGVYFSNSSNQSSLVFRNNIITNTDNAFNAWSGGTTRAFIADNNNYYATNEWANAGVVYYTLSAWRTAISGDGSSGIQDPNYVEIGINNFRLNSSSPALNSGVDILDLNSNGSSTDPINMGVYLTGSEQIGRLDGNTIERPTSVRVQRLP